MYSLKNVSLSCAAVALLTIPSSLFASTQNMCSRFNMKAAGEPAAVTARLFDETNGRAVAMSQHADVLAAYASNPFHLHWSSHALKLDEVKTEVNGMAAAWCQLAALKETERTPEVKALQERLAAVASNTQTALQLLSSDRQATWMLQYRATLKRLAASAEAFRNEADSAIRIARTQRPAGELDAALRAPAQVTE